MGPDGKGSPLPDLSLLPGCFLTSLQLTGGKVVNLVGFYASNIPTVRDDMSDPERECIKTSIALKCIYTHF